MIKIKILTAVLVLLAACAKKLPEAQVLRIFERHSFKECNPEKLKALMRDSGLAGLKLEDRYAEVVQPGGKEKVPLVKPEPSAGMFAAVKGGSYYLLKVFKGSPAEAAGLMEGDKLLAVNSARPGSKEFLAALSGSGGLRFKVSRRAKGGVSELEAEVKGAEFYLPAVFGLYEPEAGAAFVRVGLFFNGSASMIEKGLASLEKAGAKNVIFDLRGNKGGNSLEAAAVLALFTPKAGPVMGLISRHKGYTRPFSAPGRGRFAGLRVIVLTDGSTSAAAEVFAASFKEMAGAAVVGGKTAGSVSMQKSFSLGDGRGLRLTIARLAPPSGKDLEEAGLAPDSQVEASGRAAWSAAPPDALLRDQAYLRARELLAKSR